MRRRNCIKSVAALATIGSGTVSARSHSSNETIPASEIGIKEDIRDLLRKGKVEDARSLLEENNIKYGISTDKKPVFGKDESSSDGASISSRVYLRDTLDIHCTLIHNRDDIYDVIGTGVYESDEDRGEFGSVMNVPDVCGFDYNSSVWAAPDPVKENTNLYSQEPHSIELDTYEAEEGLACEIHLEDMGRYVPELVVDVHTEIEHIGDSDTIPVGFVYRHTKGYSPSSRIKSINVGSELSLSLDVSSTEVWDRPAKATVDLSDIE